MEKLSPKESVEGGDTALWGSVRAPKGFLRADPRLQNRGGAAPPEVLQPRVCPRKILREPSHRPATQYGHPRHSPEARGQLFHSALKIFNSSSDDQILEV